MTKASASGEITLDCTKCQITSFKGEAVKVSVIHEHHDILGYSVINPFFGHNVVYITITSFSLLDFSKLYQ